MDRAGAVTSGDINAGAGRDQAIIKDHNPERSSVKIVPITWLQERYTSPLDSDQYLIRLGTYKYIDFTQFCKLMAYFNPRYNLDEKIRFMFRIFDVNNDWKIDEEDLKTMVELLFG